MNKWFKGASVVVFAVVFSTLGISASDTLQGVSGTLLSMALSSQEEQGCPQDMVEMLVSGRSLCVDRFEAGTSVECRHKDPKTLIESEQNLSVSGCMPVSQAGALPWRFVSLTQAQRACAAAGKRLPSNEEWYRAALGSPVSADVCHIDDKELRAPRVLSENMCRSTVGAYDMIGNVWEWVDGSVENGAYHDRVLPSSGYVTSVDGDGVAVTSASSGDELYGMDYVWTSAEGIRGMVRGGFYHSGTDGGLYTMNASVDIGFGSAGIGFRCVRDLSTTR